VKRWPHEAQSGAWCPPFDGSEHEHRFDLERVVDPNADSRRPRRFFPADPVAWVGASPDGRPGVSRQSPVATVAAGAQEKYSLDNSFLRSCQNAVLLEENTHHGLASWSRVLQLMPRVLRTSEARDRS
jgi:hypothetical protein